MKKIKSKLVIIIILSFISSCTSFHSKRFQKKAKESRSDIIESYSDNHHIYKTNRVFHYSVNQSTDSINFNFKLDLRIIPARKAKSAFIEYSYHYSKEDIKLLNLKTECPDSLKGKCRTEISTIRESTNWVLMHPPRSKSLDILELAPFPEFIAKEKEWESELSIPKGNWGEWENTKFRWKFELDSILFDKDSVPEYHSIKSSSNSKFGLNENNFLYHRDSGFVHMNYEFENLGHVNIRLINITIDTIR